MSAADAAAGALAAELFAGLGPLRISRMFGGAGIYADGLMFALIADGVLYLKADAALAEALGAEGAAPFSYEAKGRRIALGYWRLPDAALDEPEAALAWARRALAVAAAGPARRSRRSRRAAPSV